jgi:hypothetical protein
MPTTGARAVHEERAHVGVGTRHSVFRLLALSADCSAQGENV